MRAIVAQAILHQTTRRAEAECAMLTQSEGTIKDLRHADAGRLAATEDSQSAAGTALKRALLGRRELMAHLQGGALAIVPISCVDEPRHGVSTTAATTRTADSTPRHHPSRLARGTSLP